MSRPREIMVNVDQLREIIANVPQGELITMTLYEDIYDEGVGCWFLRIYSDSLDPLANRPQRKPLEGGFLLCDETT